MADEIAELEAIKIGARNNASDAARIQQIHDLAVDNGAMCKPVGDVVELPILSMTDDDMIYHGAEVKALGGGKVGGYLVRFTAPDDGDAEGEYFDAKSELGLSDGSALPVFYHHGMDAQIKARRIGRGQVRLDDIGAWMEAQLELRDEYEKAIYEMAEAGKLGWSSGAAGHLVEREQTGKATRLKTWIIAEASLTPTPAEYRNSAVPLKSLLKSAEVAGDATPEPATKSEPATEATLSNLRGVNTMEIDEIKLQELLNSAATKAVEALASEPAVKRGGIAVTPGGDEADRALAGNPFNDFGDFLKHVKSAESGQIDKRLMPLRDGDGDYSVNVKATGLNEAIANEGGYLTQTSYSANILERMYNTGDLLPRVNWQDFGPNTTNLILPGVDETSRADGSRFGGVRGYWVGEGVAPTATKPKFRQVQLFLHKVAALVYVTDELLQDSTALGSWVLSRCPQELAFKVEDAFYNGDGVAKPLGVMSSPALATVTRTDASKVIAADLFGMWSRFWMGSRKSNSAVWMVGPDTETQLHQLYLQTGIAFPFYTIDAQGVARLFGRPVVVNEYSPALNTTGDIGLFDWSQYYASRKGGIEAASSIHVKFAEMEQAFRFSYRVDGEDSWNSALTMKNGSAATLSPFVVLGSAT